MPRTNSDLHGNAPDNARVALLLIDVINDLDFPGGDKLLRHATRAAKRIAVLQKRARQARVPSIYVNDNFGKWRSDFRKLVSHCIDDQTRGREIVELLRPQESDYFVLKPKQSGFYSTTLELLLKHLGAETLLITGWTGDICVLFTASDAHMRDYHLFIPRDCVASQVAEENTRVLEFMQRVLKADVRLSSKIDFARLR